MKKEIFEGLIENEKVDLIYSTTRFAGEKMYINYTIICDIHSATEDVKLLETIVATMYVIKELLSKHKIAFSYTVTNLQLSSCHPWDFILSGWHCFSCAQQVPGPR